MEVNMEGLLIAFFIGLIPAFIAKNKGRSFWLWYLFGVALFIVALPCALLCKDHSGMQCPACKEWIKEDAAICKHCHTVISDYYRNQNNN